MLSVSTVSTTDTLGNRALPHAFSVVVNGIVHVRTEVGRFDDVDIGMGDARIEDVEIDIDRAGAVAGVRPAIHAADGRHAPGDELP